jgi:PAS domain S-box-containing protein
LSCANRELRASEERYRLILENALDYAVVTIDRQGLLTSWNAGAERLLGYGSEKSWPILEIIPPRRTRPGTPTRRDGPRRRRRFRPGRTLAPAKGGQPFWSSSVTMPLRDEEGQHLGFLKILRDATSRKQAEDALRESEQRYRRLIRSLPAAVYTTDVQGRITL